jgi:hypothetical protein
VSAQWQLLLVVAPGTAMAHAALVLPSTQLMRYAVLVFSFSCPRALLSAAEPQGGKGAWRPPLPLDAPQLG